MKSLAFFNNKGGVSKTTSVINVGYILGEVYKRKVLIVDCDGQQNSSRFFADTINSIGFEKVLTDSNYTAEDLITNTRYENIDILTSTTAMNMCCSVYEKMSNTEKETNINNLIRFWNDKYDIVLLDMPPALNVLSETLLSLTDGVIVPVELGSFAIQGIAKVTETINKVGTTFIGCFISKYDKKNKADAELKCILEKNLGNKVFDTIIPYSNIIRNSIIYKMTAYEYMKWLNPTKKYIDLTEEIIRKVC